MLGRYELKYILERKRLNALLKLLDDCCDRDPHSAHGSYRVNSLYYDSPRFDFFQHNVDGLAYRRKVRIRHYGEFLQSTFSMYEIKQRDRQKLFKKRVRVEHGDGVDFWDESNEEPWQGSQRDQLWRNEMLVLNRLHRLEPKVFTLYRRYGFVDPIEENVRITIDHSLKGLQWRAAEMDLDSAPSLLDEDLCLVELKGSRRLPLWLVGVIRDFGFQRTRFSKYCIAVCACHLNTLHDIREDHRHHG